MSISNLTEETAVLIDAYTRFRRAHEGDCEQRNLAPYNQVSFPTKIPMHLAMFRDMAREFLRELANELNRFDRHIQQLSIWSDIYPSYDVDEQMSLMMEFIEPLATIAFGQPATLRGRFIYCMSHTSHQANLFAVESWNESRLPRDEAIKFKDMRNCSDYWSQFQNFMMAFRDLDDEAWKDSSKGFRNKYHHRIPPRFEVGHTQFVTREFESAGKVSYGFGFCEPLPLKDYIGLLRGQHSVAMSCFDSYSNMLREQWAAINYC